MMGQEQIEAFRRMTPSERWALQVTLMNAAWEAMVRLEPEELDRRLQYLRRQHDLGNQRIIERFLTLAHAGSPASDRS